MVEEDEDSTPVLERQILKLPHTERAEILLKIMFRLQKRSLDSKRI